MAADRLERRPAIWAPPLSVHWLEAQRAELGLHDLEFLVRKANAGPKADRRHDAGFHVLRLFQLGDGTGPSWLLAATLDCAKQHFCCRVASHGVSVDAFHLCFRQQALCLLDKHLSGRACEW